MCHTPFRAQVKGYKVWNLALFFLALGTLDLGLQMRTTTQSEDVNRTIILLHLTGLSANPIQERSGGSRHYHPGSDGCNPTIIAETSCSSSAGAPESVLGVCLQSLQGTPGAQAQPARGESKEAGEGKKLLMLRTLWC